MSRLLLYLQDYFGTTLKSDLEKAASGASGACGHFVGNYAILRTFSVKYPIHFTEDG